MEFAAVLIGNIVLQGAAYLILRRPPWMVWVPAAMAIGLAYQLPFLLHGAFGD